GGRSAWILPGVANSHRSRQTRAVNGPRAEPSKNVCERSVREGGHYFLNEELEAFPVEGGPECQDDPFRPGRRVLPDALDHPGRRADQDARPHEVGHGAEHQAQALLLPADLGLVPPEGQAQVRGARDGTRVAALALAPAVERGVALREDLRGEEGHVPAVGMARHEAEETLLPLPADPQTQKTRQPTRTRLVSEASAAMVATPSKAGFAGSERSDTEKRWSQTEHQWKPRSSAIRHRRRRSAIEQSCGPAWMPKRMAVVSLSRARPIAREPELVGERLEPLLGRAEAQLGLLGARRVAVQLVLDHVARAAVELVGRE